MSTVVHRTTKEVKLNIDSYSHDPVVWIINPDLSALIGVSIEYWKIVGDIVSEMSQPEKDVVDAAVLPVEIGSKVEQFRVAMRDFVYLRYAAERQQTLSVLRIEARLDGKINRAAYIGQVLVWIDSCFDYFYAKAAEIMACTTRIQVAAVTWDFTDLVTTDPNVTIYQSRTILD